MSGITIKHNRLSRYSSILMLLLGVFTLLFISGFFGLLLTLVGLIMFWFYRRQNKAVRAAPSVPVERQSSNPTVVIKEKETQVVVKIPCRYCGVLNDQLSAKCSSCGASLR